MATHYHIYANNGAGGAVDYTTPIGTATGTTFATPNVAPGSDTTFAVRAFDTVSGAEESNVDCLLRIVLDSGGHDVTLRPAPPLGLVIAPRKGKMHAQWTWKAGPNGAKPTGFHIYAGSPAISYTTPAATVAYTGSNRYGVDLTLAAGSWQVGVRAYNATAEEPNATVVTGSIDTTPPAVVPALTLAAAYAT